MVKTFAELQKEMELDDEAMIAWMVKTTGMNAVYAGFTLAMEKGEIDGDVIPMENEKIKEIVEKHFYGRKRK